MISSMPAIPSTDESPANSLCKSCGLCCSGHLFIWTKLRSAELDSLEELGVPVLRAVPSQRGFNQPCPLWNGQCTIYHSPHYPRFCQTYKCNLLKKVVEGNTTFPAALTVIEDAKTLIYELEALLPPSPSANFRERLAAQFEKTTVQDPTRIELRRKATALLAVYEEVFGVDDVIETS